MSDSMKNDKVKIITLIGMAVMIIAVAVKAATASMIAAAAIHIAGLACFFIIEGIEKTPDSESGLSFKRFFPDLKKPGVLPLILFMVFYTKYASPAYFKKSSLHKRKPSFLNQNLFLISLYHTNKS